MRLITILPLLAAALGHPRSALADVLFDQIGPMDGTAAAHDIYGSMQFVPNPSSTVDLTLAAVDDFTLSADASLDALEFVLDGWASVSGPEAVLAWEVNLYSDLEAAAANLMGDILSQSSEPIVIEAWEGDGWLIRLPIDITLSAGTYLVSAIMTNPYPDNGWVGVATSVIGNDQAWQVSPAGDYVFSPYIEAPDNLAYRLTGASIPEPSTVLLLTAAIAAPRRRRSQSAGCITT
jgi:hypothetical protein